MKTSDPMAVMQQRMTRQIDVLPSGCWVWTGAHNSKGYGRVTNVFPGQPRVVYAHRAMFFIVNGYLTPMIRHTCDNPPCCNPAHLLPGDRAENTQDALERNRFRSGPRGAKHGAYRWQRYGCRCDVCVADRQRVVLKSKQAARLREPPKHGTVIGYDYYGCRCDECRSASRDDKRRRRASAS
jgi:hypothetical protein